MWFMLPIRVLGMEYGLNCFPQRIICAENIVSHLVGAFPCIGPKGKDGPVCKREAQKLTEEQGVCVYVRGMWFVQREGWAFVNPQRTHRDNAFCLQRARGEQQLR